MRERVLVTGGAGFLGSHLCERLLQDGAEVVCLDNFMTGSVDNVRHLLCEPRFSVVEHDIVKPFRPDRPVSAVFHLASPASPPVYERHPIRTLKTGALGTAQALGIAKSHG